MNGLCMAFVFVPTPSRWTTNRNGRPGIVRREFAFIEKTLNNNTVAPSFHLRCVFRLRIIVSIRSGCSRMFCLSEPFIWITDSCFKGSIVTTRVRVIRAVSRWRRWRNWWRKRCWLTIDGSCNSAWQCSLFVPTPSRWTSYRNVLPAVRSRDFVVWNVVRYSNRNIVTFTQSL